MDTVTPAWLLFPPIETETGRSPDGAFNGICFGWLHNQWAKVVEHQRIPTLRQNFRRLASDTLACSRDHRHALAVCHAL
jgi:hypothetical protein